MKCVAEWGPTLLRCVQHGSVSHRDTDEITGLLKRLFPGFDGSVALRWWNSNTLQLDKAGPDESEPRFTVVGRDRASYVPIYNALERRFGTCG